MDTGRPPACDPRSLLGRLRKLLAVHGAHEQCVPCVQPMKSVSILIAWCCRRSKCMLNVHSA